MPANRQSSSEPAPAAWRRFGRLLWHGPRLGAIRAVQCYQLVLSPVLPFLFGPNCGCRFYPTCSHYAVESLRRHGLWAGAWLAARRLLRCHPLHPGGEDPVPETFRWWSRSARAAAGVPFPLNSRRAPRLHG